MIFRESVELISCVQLVDLKRKRNTIRVKIQVTETSSKRWRDCLKNMNPMAGTAFYNTISKTWYFLKIQLNYPQQTLPSNEYLQQKGDKEVRQQECQYAQNQSVNSHEL